MHPILQSILSGIDADEVEAFVAASEMIRAHKIGPHNAVIEPYASIYAAQALEEQDVDMLKRSLTHYLENAKGVHPSAAIHALGALRDKELIPLLRSLLPIYLGKLTQQTWAVGQLNVELSNLGEEVISGTSYSVTDVNKNTADAIIYLQKYGIMS